MSWRFFGGGSDKKAKHERKKHAADEVAAPSLEKTIEVGDLTSSQSTAPAARAEAAAATRETEVNNQIESMQVIKSKEDEERIEEQKEDDDTYDVLAVIEKTSLENKKMLTMLLKRNKLLEQRLDEYDKLFSRLTEYLDVQQIQDARAHNRLLRLGMPVPFRSTQTDRVGMERVPSHSADRWQSVAQGPRIHRNSIFSHHTGQPMCSVGVHRDI